MKAVQFIVRLLVLTASGLLQPVNGFGNVWVTDSGLRDRIGWASAPEQAQTERML